MLMAGKVSMYEAMLVDATWPVRQAACRILPLVFDRSGNEWLDTFLRPMYERLLNDDSTQVQTTALEVSGKVIYSYKQRLNYVPDAFLRAFTGQIRPIDLDGISATRALEVNSSSDDDATTSYKPAGHVGEEQIQAVNGWTSNTGTHERAIARAYNLPAVVLSVGSQRWPELRPLYQQLIKYPLEAVRRSLAASQFELVRMVSGTVEDETLFLSSWMAFVEDVPAVQSAAVSHFADLLSAGSESFMRACLTELVSCWPSIQSWRAREAVSAQLGSITQVCESIGALDLGVAFCKQAISDRVAIVRENGLVTVSGLATACCLA